MSLTFRSNGVRCAPRGGEADAPQPSELTSSHSIDLCLGNAVLASAGVTFKDLAQSARGHTQHIGCSLERCPPDERDAAHTCSFVSLFLRERARLLVPPHVASRWSAIRCVFQWPISPWAETSLLALDDRAKASRSPLRLTLDMSFKVDPLSDPSMTVMMITNKGCFIVRHRSEPNDRDNKVCYHRGWVSGFDIASHYPISRAAIG